MLSACSVGFKEAGSCLGTKESSAGSGSVGADGLTVGKSAQGGKHGAGEPKTGS